MPHLFIEGSIAVLNHCALTWQFQTHQWMVGMQAHLTNCTFLPPRLTSQPPTHPSALLLMNYTFSPQKCKFSNQITKTRFRPQNQTTGKHCDFYVFFLTSIYLKVSNLTAPLKRSGRFFWSWNNFDWIRFLCQFCIKICHFIQFIWCEKATDQILSLYPLSSKTSYRKISWNIEAVSFGFKLFQSLWNLTGTSAAVLLRLSNFRVIRL